MSYFGIPIRNGIGIGLDAYSGFKSKITSWSPATLSPLIWADASDASTVILNGSTVSQWSDKSGNGRHLVQATASKQPAYNATTFNNKPGITFDGVDDIFLSNQVTSISGAAPRTMAIVFRRGSGGALIQFGTTTTLRAFGRVIATTGLLYHWSSDLTMSAAASGVNTQEVLQSTGAVSTGYRSGTLIASGSYALNTANTVLYVGGREGPDFSGGINYCGCVISEILVFDKVLLASDRQLLEGYFAWKWGAL